MLRLESCVPSCAGGGAPEVQVFDEGSVGGCHHMRPLKRNLVFGGLDLPGGIGSQELLSSACTLLLS